MQLTFSFCSVQPFSERHRGLVACDRAAAGPCPGRGGCVDGREVVRLVYDLGQTCAECLGMREPVVHAG